MTVDGEYVGKTEIIEASEPESESCQLPEYPKPTGGATGGLVKNKVIVCGGANWKHQVDPFSECYAFKDNQVKINLPLFRFMNHFAIVNLKKFEFLRQFSKALRKLDHVLLWILSINTGL